MLSYFHQKIDVCGFSVIIDEAIVKYRRGGGIVLNRVPTDSLSCRFPFQKLDSALLKINNESL